jgi:hypothetical protein
MSSMMAQQAVAEHGIYSAYLSTNSAPCERVGLHGARLLRFLGSGEGGFHARNCTTVFVRTDFASTL